MWHEWQRQSQGQGDGGGLGGVGGGVCCCDFDAVWVLWRGLMWIFNSRGPSCEVEVLADVLKDGILTCWWHRG